MESLTVSNKALSVINLVKNAVSSSITGVSFFSVKNYENSFGEVSNQLINVGINYEKSKVSDIETLENIDLTAHNFKSDLPTLKLARLELINAFLKPNENRSNGQKDAYTTIFPGVKVHNETFIIKKILDNDNIIIKNDRIELEIPAASFQRCFYIAFCLTSHKAQGQTYSRPFSISEFNKMSTILNRQYAF